MKSNKRTVEFGGSLWLEKAGRRFLDSEGIKLLEKIGEVGSITRAAIAVGISYKTAWDRVNQINSQADTPLVKRLTGGRGGGGTKLTQSGKEIISRFRAAQEEHRRFLDRIGGSCGVGDGPATYWERISNKPRNSGMFSAHAPGWEGNRSAQPPLSFRFQIKDDIKAARKKATEAYIAYVEEPSTSQRRERFDLELE